MNLNYAKMHKYFENIVPYERIGKVIANHGPLFEVGLTRVSLGTVVEFTSDELSKIGGTWGNQNSEQHRILGEVVKINKNTCFVMPYDNVSGINSDTQVRVAMAGDRICVGEHLLGRVIDCLGEPLDGKGPIEKKGITYPLLARPINPLERPVIDQALDTKIHALNCFATVGKGQRLAILAGSGVGKSVLMGMLATHTQSDVNVIALIGERGREVLEFIKNDLGEEGLARSVVVVATSDQGPLLRMKAAYVATAIAEYFRDQRNDVLLMMDSLTRFAMAAREIGLNAGEAPGPKGYPPSIFAKLPLIMERAGTKNGVGTITGFYTVLVEGGDMDEPVTDAVRAISDGHIVLSRDLASKNIFPAIDVLKSISRVMNKVTSKEHRVVAGHLRELMAIYRENEDLITVGAYAPGANPKLDKAVRVYEGIVNLLKQAQDFSEFHTIDFLYDRMVDLARLAENIEQTEQDS